MSNWQAMAPKERVDAGVYGSNIVGISDSNTEQIFERQALLACKSMISMQKGDERDRGQMFVQVIAL